MFRSIAAALCVCVLAPCAAASAAASDAPALYVVPEVFLPAAKTEPIEAASQALPAKDMADYFAGKFKAAFPSAVDSMTDASSRRTFVVSLQIERVSSYAIPKATGNVERQVAMTGSLYFTNVRTGEVLFTSTHTAYLDKETRPSGAAAPEGAELYAPLYRQLVDELLPKAAAAFKPYQLAVTAKKSFAGLIVLDKGQLAGLGLGDALTAPDGADARTIFVEPNYAVAEVQLGKGQTGGVWSKFASGALSAVHKVDAVVDLGEGANQSALADEEVRQLFADSLGEKTPIAVLPVNPDFAEVVNYVRGHTDVSREVTAARKLPAYYVRLTVLAPLTWEAPTNVAYKTVRSVRARVYAEVIDRSGRVQYAGFGENDLNDEVTEGMGYTPEARAEVAIKNAMLDLTRKMESALKLERVDTQIASVEQTAFAAADPKGVLKVSSNLTILHGIGSDAGQTLYLPSWTAHVTETSSGQARAVGDLAVFSGAPAIRSGDVARLETVGLPVAQTRLGLCGGDGTLGSRKVAGLTRLGEIAFAGKGRANTYARRFVAAEAGKLHDTGDFEDGADRQAAEPELCVQPVDRIEVLGEDCDPRGVCVTRLQLAVGYRILRGGEIVHKAAVQTTVRSEGYLKTMSPETRDRLIDADVLANAEPIFEQVAQQPDLY